MLLRRRNLVRIIIARRLDDVRHAGRRLYMASMMPYGAPIIASLRAPRAWAASGRRNTRIDGGHADAHTA